MLKCALLKLARGIATTEEFIEALVSNRRQKNSLIAFDAGELATDSRDIGKDCCLFLVPI